MSRPDPYAAFGLAWVSGFLAGLLFVALKNGGSVDPRAAALTGPLLVAIGGLGIHALADSNSGETA